jgi:hypothetical protein
MADATFAGLPPEQVQSWLDSINQQIQRVQTRLDYLQSELARLQEQEGLLLELMASASAPIA